MLFDLVFEGGGMRGVAFVGALEALADSGHEFGRVMGSSVGGLAAALLSTGHDARTLRDLIFDPQTGYLAFADAMSASYPPFTRQAIKESATRRLLSDVDFSFFPDLIEDSLDALVAHGIMGKQKLHPLFSFIEHMSISEDSQWMAWLDELINMHADDEDWASMGLSELYQKTGRSLTVIASDISEPTMLVLNHSTAPELPLKWAVRMTTSVPILFPPVSWRPEWGMYRKRRLEGHLIVDGALLSKFPLELFLSTQKESEEMMGKRLSGNNVLGLLLDETLPVPGITPSNSPWERRIKSVPGLNLTGLLLNTLLANSGGPTADVVGSRVLRLPVSGIDVYGFEVHRDQLLPAINKAYNVTQEFLSGWQDDPRAHLTQFEQQYVQIVAEQFIVSGDYYKIGDIIGSKGVAIGEAASVDIQQSGDMP